MIKFRFKSLFLTLFLFSISSTSYALVDYSENDSAPARATKKRAVKKTSRAKAPSRNTNQASYTPSGMFNLSTQYESIDVQADSIDNKVSLLNVLGRFHTGYNVFVDFSFWRGSTDSKDLSSSSSGQNGNPSMVVGFNWITFGQQEEQITVDLYAGARIKGDSELASSRNDQIFGLETTKKFYQFTLGIGYELQVTGDVKDSEELAIGNIQKLAAAIAWQATPDIQFIVEAETVTINEGESSSEVGGVQGLSEKQTVGHVSPEILLGISPLVNLQLGATFRTNKVKNNQNITNSKLWNIKGIYGNSIHAGLNIAI